MSSSLTTVLILTIHFVNADYAILQYCAPVRLFQLVSLKANINTPESMLIVYSKIISTLGSSHVSYHYILGVIPYGIFTFLHSTQNADKKKESRSTNVYLSLILPPYLAYVLQKRTARQ